MTAKISRPLFERTPEIEDEILSGIARGESVAAIYGASKDDFIPSEVTFYKRLALDADLANRYTRARLEAIVRRTRLG